MGIAVDNDRTTLQNLTTLDYIAFPLTPHLVSTSVSANYNGAPGVAAPNEKQIYANTGGETAELEFPYYRVALEANAGLTREKAIRAMIYHRSFVRSLLSPGTRADGTSEGAPALCLLTVPGILAWVVRVRKFDKEERVDDAGNLIFLSMKILFQEEWEAPLSAESLLLLGYSRG